MKIELHKIKPNPFRDFAVDPIDPEITRILKQSTKELGHWGGLVGRRCKDSEDIELASGMQRLQAAKEQGLTTVDVHIGDYDDTQMALIYGKENATQRGIAGTAQAGIIAAATRMLLRERLLSNSTITSPKGGRPYDDHEIGRPQIVKFLKTVPGINDSVVRDQLANLKTSGHYDRIVDEVVEEVEREAKEAEEKAEREEAEAQQRQEAEAAAKAKAKKEQAKKRRAKAAKTKAREKKDPSFDFNGVAKHLKNDSQIEAFRSYVAKLGLEMLPIDKQAAAAADLVHRYEEYKKNTQGFKSKHITVDFIRSEMSLLIQDAHLNANRENAERTKKLLEKDIQFKWKTAMHHFSRNAQGCIDDAQEMIELMAKYPDTDFYLTNEFMTHLNIITEHLNKLNRKLNCEKEKGETSYAAAGLLKS
jgi:ParB-like chromosome segregation protein Spo0J